VSVHFTWLRLTATSLNDAARVRRLSLRGREQELETLPVANNRSCPGTRAVPTAATRPGWRFMT